MKHEYSNLHTTLSETGKQKHHSLHSATRRTGKHRITNPRGVLYTNMKQEHNSIHTPSEGQRKQRNINFKRNINWKQTRKKNSTSFMQDNVKTIKSMHLGVDTEVVSYQPSYPLGEDFWQAQMILNKYGKIAFFVLPQRGQKENGSIAVQIYYRR